MTPGLEEHLSRLSFSLAAHAAAVKKREGRVEKGRSSTRGMQCNVMRWLRQPCVTSAPSFCLSLGLGQNEAVAAGADAQHSQVVLLLLNLRTDNLDSCVVVHCEHGRAFPVAARYRNRRRHVPRQLHAKLEARGVALRARTAEALFEVGLAGALDRGQRVMAVRQIARCGLDGERFPAWRGRLQPEEVPGNYKPGRGGPHVAATNDTSKAHSQQSVVSNIMSNLLENGSRNW